ncbi:MAG: ORF6N domain-containing protein [Verrucomicrobia bacterium]|nr:ORF6N domain-containing protein [Verrucomicrobiota bacterium]
MPTSAPELTQPSELRLFTARGQTVVLDGDLARLYGVSTKVFNQAIRRNKTRFPSDFLFRLTPEEWAALRSQIVTLKPAGRGEHRKYRPLAFTEHGAIMAATVLNSPRAVAMSVYVVRAFVRLREELLGRANLERRLAEIERTLVGHDAALRDLYQKLKPLLLPAPAKTRREIGFHAKDQLTTAEAKLAGEVAAEGLSIQDKFRPEPLYKQTGKGHYSSDTVEEIRRARTPKPQGGQS